MKKTQKLIILVKEEVGAGYVAPCSFNTTREVTFETGVMEVPVIDCDNPDAPAWIARAADTFSCSISGAGTLDTEDHKKWVLWFESGIARLCRVKLDVPLADGGGDYQGEFIIGSMGLGKEGRGYVTFSAELQSNGPVLWTDAAA